MVKLKSDRREYGRSELTIKKQNKLLKNLPKKLTVWNSHGDAIVKIPTGFTGIASTENSDFRSSKMLSSNSTDCSFILRWNIPNTELN